MAPLNIALPPQEAQTTYNLSRWSEVLSDPRFTQIEGRIETDRHGHILMSPPPAPNHGSLQAEIAYLLRSLVREGRVLTECPISTADGVRAGDVAWASPSSVAELGNQGCFPRSPEICVEVLSPSNTDAEIREKMALYFDAGAKEVWLCNDAGSVSFFEPRGGPALPASRLVPDFPAQVTLR